MILIVAVFSDAGFTPLKASSPARTQIHFYYYTSIYVNKKTSNYGNEERISLQRTDWPNGSLM